MGFRSDDEALRHRVDALEGQLAEKDAELERVKEELEAERQPPPGPPAATSEVSVAAPTKVPEPSSEGQIDGDVWTFTIGTHDRWWRPVLAGWTCLSVLLPAILYVRGDIPRLEAVIGGLLAGVPALIALVYRSGVVVDRKARTVTIWRWWLLRWNKTVPFEGREISVETLYTSSEHGDSYVIGHIMLGDQLLAVRRELSALAMAKRLAEFAAVTYGGSRHEEAKHLRRRVWWSIAFTAVVLAAVGVVVLLLDSD